MKWIGVIVLAIVGIIAAIVAVEYLTTNIYHLPSVLGGKHIYVSGHPIRGHYKKRGYAALVVAIVALAGAVYWAIRIQRAGTTGGPAVAAPAAAPQASGGSADSLLASPAPAPEAPSSES